MRSPLRLAQNWPVLSFLLLLWFFFFFHFCISFNEFRSLNSFWFNGIMCCQTQIKFTDFDICFLKITALLTLSWKLVSSTLRMRYTLSSEGEDFTRLSYLLCLPEQSSGDRAMWSQLLKIVGQEHLVTINIVSFFQPSLWS